MKRIYLDHYRTTPLDKDIFDVMKPYFEDKFYLPASFTSWGTETAEIIENAKEMVLKSFNAEKYDLFFTNGATLANNLAIHGVLRDADYKNSHIITSEIAHPSILKVYEYYRKKGVKVTYLKVDEKGFIDTDSLRNELNKDTKIVSICYVNHTIGTIQNVKEISKIVKEYNEKIKILVDATLAINSIKIDFKELNIDFLSLSGHKIYGPKGSGALLYKSTNNFKPIIFGAVETSVFSPGADNIPAIVGLSKAVKKSVKNIEKYSSETRKIQKYIMDRIENEISDTVLNGPLENRAPDNVNYSFRFIEGESIMMFLDFENIVIATGSACASSDLKVNYILSAIGRNHELAHGSLRITLGKYNTLEEAKIFIDTLKPIVNRLRSQSTIRR
jgi:cysteine desulfurase